jgi:hypothetical protein
MIDTLFTVTLAELFMGGGGRLLHMGPVTLRMILFAICLVVGAVAILFRLRSMDGQRLAFGLVMTYLLVHVFGLLIGAVNGAEFSDMISEFQQSLYWLAAPFFALVLQSPTMVYKTSVLVRLAGVLLALGYIAVLALLAIGRLSILEVLPILTDSGEVIVRGENFLFYKGFLYLGLAIIFFVAIRGRFWRTLVILVGVALVLTLTRGFLLSVSVSVLLMLAAQGRRVVAGMALVAVAIGAFIVFIYVPSLNEKISSSQTESNTQRQQDFREIVDHVTPQSLLIGEGYGAMVNDRFNIENTFLWAVWKLGVTGLLFWVMPLGLCAYYYLKIPNRSGHATASAFFFGTVLVNFQTLTNPYLNNPIGLSFVIAAIFSLRTLSKQAQAKLREAKVHHVLMNPNLG